MVACHLVVLLSCQEERNIASSIFAYHPSEPFLPSGMHRPEVLNFFFNVQKMKFLVVIRDGHEQQVFAKELMLSVQVVCLFLGGIMPEFPWNLEGLTH